MATVTVTQAVTLFTTQLNRFQALVAKQFDKVSRFLDCTIVGENDEVLSIPSSASVYINARRSDDESASFTGSVNGDGTVRVPISYWMLTLDGPVYADVSIYTENETVLTTTEFEIYVQRANADQSEIDPEDPDYVTLETLIAEVSSIKSDVYPTVVADLSTTVVTLTAQSGYRYQYTANVTSMSVTPAVDVITDVVFKTAAAGCTLTVPSTVSLPAGLGATTSGSTTTATLAGGYTYELNILDNMALLEAWEA